MKTIGKFAAGVAVALALTGGQACAASWIVTYNSTGGSPFTANLSLDAADVLNAVGGFDVFGVTGDVDGDAVTGLIANPGQPFAHYSADGLFIYDNVFFAGGPPVFSNPGLFFSGASGAEYNLFSDNPATYELYRARSGVGYLDHSVGAVTAALDPGRTFATDARGGAVPEPAAWSMMILGFGAIGALMRRRRTNPALA